MLLQMLALYPLTFLEREFFSRGVWVCFSILFSESTQLLKTCLNAESETHSVFQLLEFVKRLEGRPETENVGCPLCRCRAEHWDFELLTTQTAAASLSVYSKMPAILTATILTLTILFLFCVVLGSGFFAKAFC